MRDSNHYNETNILLEKRIKNSKIFADIQIPNIKLVIEFNGDYWHCNPQKYKSDYFNKKKSLYAKEIWERDAQRLEKIKKLGYSVVVVWENDFLMDKDKIYDSLFKTIKELQ